MNNSALRDECLGTSEDPTLTLVAGWNRETMAHKQVDQSNDLSLSTEALILAIKRWKESAQNTLDMFDDENTNNNEDSDTKHLSNIVRKALDLQLDLQEYVVTPDRPHRRGEAKRARVAKSSHLNFLSLPHNIITSCLRLLSGKDICATACTASAFHPIGLIMRVAMAETRSDRTDVHTVGFLSQIRARENWGSFVDQSRFLRKIKRAIPISQCVQRGRFMHKGRLAYVHHKIVVGRHDYHITGYVSELLATALPENQIVQVAAGNRHHLLLLDSGTVLSYGENIIPIGRKRPHTLTSNRYHPEWHCTPAPITALQNDVIVAVSAGHQHCLVLNIRGEVLSFGCGQDGRLGHGPQCIDRVTPCMVEGLRGIAIRHISAGYVHNIVLSATGEAYTFGYGNYGELGHGLRTKSQNVPRVIERLLGNTITEASAGDSHTLVLDHTGSLWSFGHGELGNLGHGNAYNQHEPKRVYVGETRDRLVGVSAGNFHSVIWTVTGQLLTFGLGSTGLLGLEDFRDRDKPTLVPCLRGKHVVTASAGEEFTIVRTRTGQTFAFGPGLGQNPGLAELIPRRIVGQTREPRGRNQRRRRRHNTVRR